MKMVHGIAATIWVWCIFLAVSPSSAIEEVSGEQVFQLGNYPTENFDLGAGTRGYTQFLTRLRNRLTATRACNMPVTRNNLPTGSEYVLVDLRHRTNRNQFITLAIQVNNLYVVAYRVGGTTQGIFLNEPNVEFARSRLFERTQTQPTRQYDSNYNNIESVAGIRRASLPLGLQELQRRIETFFPATTLAGAEEARFLLTAIQMISEAARFKYIENLVVRSGASSSFRPDSKMLDLENNWGKISKAVHQSNEQVPNQCVRITPIGIGTETWHLVSNVRTDVSLLMYKTNKVLITSTPSHRLFPHIVANIAADVGELEQEFLEASLM